MVVAQLDIVHLYVVATLATALKMDAQKSQVSTNLDTPVERYSE